MTKRATPCVEATNASARFLDRDDDASPSPPRPKTAAYVGLAAVQLSYCVWHVLGKIALNGGANPFVLALYRQLGACVCLYVLARCVDYRSGGLGDALKALSRRQRRRFVLLGFLGFCNIFGFVVALSYVTAFNSALLHPIIPVIAAAAAAAAGIERATPPKAAGVALAASGALVVVVAGGSGGGESNPDASPASVAFGNAILLGQCGAMGCLLVLQKSILFAPAREYSSSSPRRRRRVAAASPPRRRGRVCRRDRDVPSSPPRRSPRAASPPRRRRDPPFRLPQERHAAPRDDDDLYVQRRRRGDRARGDAGVRRERRRRLRADGRAGAPGDGVPSRRG